MGCYVTGEAPVASSSGCPRAGPLAKKIHENGSSAHAIFDGVKTALKMLRGQTYAKLLSGRMAWGVYCGSGGEYGGLNNPEADGSCLTEPCSYTVVQGSTKCACSLLPKTRILRRQLEAAKDGFVFFSFGADIELDVSQGSLAPKGQEANHGLSAME